MGRFKNDKRHVSKKDFVRLLAKNSGYNQEDVLTVVDCIEETLEELLSNATEATSVEVNLTHNIRIENYYTAAKNRMNPKSGEMFVAPAHFRTRAKFLNEMQRIGG